MKNNLKPPKTPSEGPKVEAFSSSGDDTTHYFVQGKSTIRGQKVVSWCFLPAKLLKNRVYVSTHVNMIPLPLKTVTKVDKSDVDGIFTSYIRSCPDHLSWFQVVEETVELVGEPGVLSYELKMVDQIFCLK